MQKDSDTAKMIQDRAYHIWEAAGRPHGCDQAHWFQAERELVAPAPASARPAAAAAPTTRQRAPGPATRRRQKPAGATV